MITSSIHDSANAARKTGYGMVILGIYLNIPFATLGMIFSYPEILRQPAGEILTRYVGGGPVLLGVWYAFVLAALAMVALAWIARSMGLAAAVAGILAGVFQAIGLIRWVLVVPVLARSYTSPNATAATRDAATLVFDALHAYAGVAIGEHLGQLLTAAWVMLLASSLGASGHVARWQVHLGHAAAALIVAGLAEGFATVLPFDPGLWGLATPAGFIVLSAWMVAVGITLIHRAALPSRSPASTRSNA